ncbi:hypothetical protein PR048_022847 [Dryococelus australis]|uniref:Uncharacterized protein n=1 Tax=Dryococelus australis TaxID=614101 RepID=A0ABQ9GSG5_9NEOP|nr:hypothetical protein PR048_022847 [Dryococelus australis]
MMLVLQSDDSPFGIPPISDVDASWLASIPSMSRLLTIPLYGYVMERIGRKVTGYLLAAPFIISWLMLLLANSMSMLFWSSYILLDAGISSFPMTKGKTEESKKALRWLRNGEDSEFELNRIQFRAEEILEERKQKISLKIITERSTWRALLICMGLIINQQLCGPAPITSYTLVIFQESGTTISASIATVLIGSLQTIGSLLSSMTRVGLGFRDRRMASSCLFVHIHPDIWHGIRTTAFHDGDRDGYPPGAQSGPKYMHSDHCINHFRYVMSFMPLVALIGHHGCFWLYAVVCIVGTICIFLTVPETKNRSIEDVVEQLKRDDYIRSVLRGIWQHLTTLIAGTKARPLGGASDYLTLRPLGHNAQTLNFTTRKFKPNCKGPAVETHQCNGVSSAVLSPVEVVRNNQRLPFEGGTGRRCLSVITCLGLST